MNDFEKKIKDYLDKRAAEDELFAKSYAKEKKSFEECIRYIFGEAFKVAVAMDGCGSGAAFEDEHVFGLAVHYYDEDDIKLNPIHGDVKVSTNMSEPAPVMPQGKPGKAPKSVKEYKPTKRDREKAREAAMRKLEAEELKKLRTPRKRRVEVDANQMSLFA